MPGDTARGPAVDAHSHVFCWGENPRDGFISERLRRSMMTRLLVRLTKVEHEPGETLSEKIRARLLRQLESSRLDHAIVLAQDGVYRTDGSFDHDATHFYVSNDYVLELAGRSPKVIPGTSINPWRRDALAELERCFEAGARLVKIHTAIQGVDPSLSRFDPFYKRAAELGMVLMFHTGYEHSAPVVSQKFTSPDLLERALAHGGKIVAAHCGSCACFDRADYFPAFVRMMQRHANLFGDTAILSAWNRPRALSRLARAGEGVLRRVLHGSDYPFPPARWPHACRIGLFPRDRGNPLDLDLSIKTSYNLGEGYASRILTLLGQPTGN